MDIKNETYRQRSFFQTGMPLFGAALLFLIPAFCFCLRKDSLLPAVALLAAGLLFIMLGTGSVKRETKRILGFVRETSVFYHKYDPPLTISGLVDGLKKEGFEVEEYPFGNYYGHRYTGRKYCCHFFVANNDTPDCPEAESYSRLFIQTVCAAGMAAGSQYLLDLEYGAGLEQRAPDYIRAVREGFLHEKNGVIFGIRLAYDTRENILYFAEAVIRIIWHKSETSAIYSGELLKRLLFEQGGRQDISIDSASVKGCSPVETGSGTKPEEAG